jgi:hypothetical protein
MKSLHLAAVAVFGVFLLAAGSVRADQNICANLQLNNFINSTVIAGYRTSDIGAFEEECSAESSSSCSKCVIASASPKNVGNYLCLPSNFNYSLTANCTSLIQAGSSENCQKNSADDVCDGQAVVEPICNYRTNDNTSEAGWTWTVTSTASNTFSVDCTNNNYYQYSQ